MRKSLFSSWLLVVAIFSASMYIQDIAAQHHHPAPPPSGGQVSLKVYRGPSKGYGYHSFAPWGYYARVPPEDTPPVTWPPHYGRK